MTSAPGVGRVGGSSSTSGATSTGPRSAWWATGASAGPSPGGPRASACACSHHARRDTGAPGFVADLDALVAEADVVSLHVPLSADTRHLLDARRLAQMKSTAVLVNTSRGPVVDEEALAVALEEGTIFAAGLDVYEHEPDVHPRLLAAPRTVLLPHVGSASVATRTRMARVAAEGVRAVLAGERPANLVT